LSPQPATIFEGVPEYVDVVCIAEPDFNQQAVFCVQPPCPASIPIEEYFYLDSVHELEIVITSSGRAARFRFTFKWVNRPEDCDFSVVEITPHEPVLHGAD
jgi:hypothetical protein